MNGIKNMLLGIAIMLAVIVFHLFCAMMVFGQILLQLLA